MDKNRYKKSMNRAVEEGCYSRAAGHWGELLGAYRARDLGMKIVALEALIAQLRAWYDLLKMGGGNE